MHKHELLLKEQVYAIVGAAMEVLNELGHGMIEKPYENALVVGLGLRGMKVSPQLRHVVRYKGIALGEYIPDIRVLPGGSGLPRQFFSAPRASYSCLFVSIRGSLLFSS